MIAIRFPFINSIAFFYKLLMLIFVLQFSKIQAQIKIPPYSQKGDMILVLATAQKNTDDNLKHRFTA